MSDRLVVSVVDCMTAVGLDATATLAATRAGISRLRESEQFVDTQGNPIIESCIPWLPPEAEPVEAEEQSRAEGEPDPADEAMFGEEPAAGDDLDGLDPYELARQTDDVTRVVQAGRQCFSDLLAAHVPPRADGDADGGAVTFVLAVAGAWRPGPRFEGVAHEFANELLAALRRRVPHADAMLIPSGNAAAIRGIGFAAERIANDPSTICLLAGVDSLLPIETLNWYESAGRLKSGTPGRNHGLPPSEAVGFLVVESAASAKRAGRPVLAEIGGIGLAVEPNPFLSDRPSRGQGLTDACRKALATSTVPPSEVGEVLMDLDGEYHRAKEWALAYTRCFSGAGGPRVVHPAESFGAIGAASAAVLIGIGALGLAEGWLKKSVLVVCSDDAGECGAVLLTPSTDMPRP
jgi:hypothetical protein